MNRLLYPRALETRVCFLERVVLYQISDKYELTYVRCVKQSWYVIVVHTKSTDVIGLIGASEGVVTGYKVVQVR